MSRSRKQARVVLAIEGLEGRLALSVAPVTLPAGPPAGVVRAPGPVVLTPRSLPPSEVPTPDLSLPVDVTMGERPPSGSGEIMDPVPPFEGWDPGEAIEAAGHAKPPGTMPPVPPAAPPYVPPGTLPGTPDGLLPPNPYQSPIPDPFRPADPTPYIDPMEPPPLPESIPGPPGYAAT